MRPRPSPRFAAILARLGWLPWTLIAVALLSSLTYLSLTATQSRWRLERRYGTATPPRELGRSPGWLLFTEKLVPASRARTFRAAFPEEAIAFYARLGLRLPDPRSKDLVVFGAWKGYAGIHVDDGTILEALKPRNDGSLAPLARLAEEFRLDEPVAASYVTPDGDFLFLDLSRDQGPAAIHGLAHVLARRSRPQFLRPTAARGARADEDPAAVAAFRFLDEAGACLLSELAASGALSAEVGTRIDLSRYEAWIEARYAPDGPILSDPDLTFRFSSDPRGPAAFAGAARFGLEALKARGEEAVKAWLSALLSGSYSSLDELCAPLGGRLPDLLGAWLGSPAIPQ